MKYFTFLLLLIPMVGISDPRINVKNNTCHLPIDPLYAGTEINASACGGVVVEDSGTAAGYVEKNGLTHITTLPIVLQPADAQPVIISINWQDLPNTKCKLYDANHNKYLSGRWWSRVVLKRQKRTLPNGQEILTARVKWHARLRCIDGAPPPPPAT